MSDLTVEMDEGRLNIRVGAIIRKGNKILMAGNERDDFYYSVGGRIKFGESAEDAIKREVYEETGVKMEVERLGYIHENFFEYDLKGEGAEKIHELSFFFFMQVPDDFEPVSEYFMEGSQKEFLAWIDIDTDEKYYPEFFRKELLNISHGVRHFITRE